MGRKPPKPEGREASPRYVGKAGDGPKTLKALLKDVPPEDEQAHILIRLGDPSVADEATVLISGAILELNLKDAISRHFRSGLRKSEIEAFFDFERNGPLADFSAKIKLSYLLGIGSKKTNDDLTTIRVIRNVFAHTPRHVNFSDQAVENACGELHAVKEASLLSLAGLNTKQRFVYAVFQYHFGLRTYMPRPRGSIAPWDFRLP